MQPSTPRLLHVKDIAKRALYDTEKTYRTSYHNPEHNRHSENNLNSSPQKFFGLVGSQGRGSWRIGVTYVFPFEYEFKSMIVKLFPKDFLLSQAPILHLSYSGALERADAWTRGTILTSFRESARYNNDLARSRQKGIYINGYFKVPMKLTVLLMAPTPIYNLTEAKTCDALISVLINNLPERPKLSDRIFVGIRILSARYISLPSSLWPNVNAVCSIWVAS